MLSESEIWERLNEGKLAIFPFDPADVNSTGVILRLGSDFVVQTEGTIENAKPTISTVGIGDRIQVLANSSVVIVTLQFISMPLDLAGLIQPRSKFARLGLIMEGGMVSPGFQGKLAMTLFNLGKLPVTIYPGMHIASLVLFGTRAPAKIHSSYPVQIEDTQSEDLNEIRRTVETASQQVKSSYTPPTTLVNLLDLAITSPHTEKGKLLETFATELIKTVEGLKVIRVNAHLRAEELDILVQNDLDIGFWRFLGSPIIVECKNWSGKVGAKDISILADKLTTLGPDSKTGILIAPNGITGNATADAWLKVREWRARGKNILVLDNEILNQLRDGRHPTELLERALQTLWLV